MGQTHFSLSLADVLAVPVFVLAFALAGAMMVLWLMTYRGR